MIQKLFPLDKNYILKQAQQYSEDQLLVWMIEFVKVQYETQCNPLGLIDDTIQKIRATKGYNLEPLREFYFELSAIYRYQNSDNQLELLFDGRNHEDKYLEDWQNGFKRWVYDFVRYPNYLRAVLEAAIFYPTDRKALLAGNRMKAFTNQYFELKIYKHKGLQRLKSA